MASYLWKLKRGDRVLQRMGFWCNIPEISCCHFFHLRFQRWLLKSLIDILLFISRTILNSQKFSEFSNMTFEEVATLSGKEEDAFWVQCSKSSSSLSFKRNFTLIAVLRRTRGGVPSRTCHESIFSENLSPTTVLMKLFCTAVKYLRFF